MSATVREQMLIMSSRLAIEFTHPSLELFQRC